jgi:hypothetical protein
MDHTHTVAVEAAVEVAVEVAVKSQWKRQWKRQWKSQWKRQWKGCCTASREASHDQALQVQGICLRPHGPAKLVSHGKLTDES